LADLPKSLFEAKVRRLRFRAEFGTLRPCNEKPNSTHGYISYNYGIFARS
jgi:hypothetical protein